MAEKFSAPTPTCDVTNVSVVELKVYGTDLPGTEDNCVTAITDVVLSKLADFVEIPQSLADIFDALFRLEFDAVGWDPNFHLEKVTYRCSDGSEPSETRLVWGCPLQGCASAGELCNPNLPVDVAECCQGMACLRIPDLDPALEEHPPGKCNTYCGKQDEFCSIELPCCGFADCRDNRCGPQIPPSQQPQPPGHCFAYAGDPCEASADCCGGNTCPPQVGGAQKVCQGGAQRPQPRGI